MDRCVSCHKNKPNLDADGECYPCSKLGIGVTFIGGGYRNNRAAFHDQTNKEVRERNFREATKSGREVVPMSSRKELI